MDKAVESPEVVVSPAEAIRAKFSSKTTIAQAKKESTEKAQVEAILDKAKEREAMYTQVGQTRAETTEKEQEKHDKGKTAYKSTTLRITHANLLRLKKLEYRFVSENCLLTYEKVFLAGLERIENMNDAELKGFIEKIER